jgi:hypothetical protein
MSDLKPCPICGSTKIEEYDEWVDVGDPYAHITNHIVECRNCNYSRGDCTRDNAIKRWNTRPAEDAKDKEIKRMKAEVRKLATELNNINILADNIMNNANFGSKITKAEMHSRLTSIYVYACHIKRALVRTDDAPDTNVGTMEG